MPLSLTLPIRPLRTLALAIGASLLVSAHAADAGAERRIAVFASIGDQLNVISYGSATTGRTDQNQRQSFATGSTAFDSEALIAAEKALHEADADAKVVLLAPGSLRGTAEQQDELFEGETFLPTKRLAAALAQENATHLLIITKHHARASLKLRDVNVGSGVLEGLGYYVDQQLWVQDGNNDEVGRGFLAPYAYIKLTLVDLKTSHVIARHLATASTTFSATTQDTDKAVPWNALTPEQKTEALNRLIREEIAKDVPALLTTPAKNAQPALSGSAG